MVVGSVIKHTSIRGGAMMQQLTATHRQKASCSSMRMRRLRFASYSYDRERKVTATLINLLTV